MTRSRLVALALTLATVLAACGGGTAPAPAAPSPAVAQRATCTPKNVTLAVPVTPPNVVHLPPFVAQGLGYFKDESLTVEFKRFEGGVGSLRSAAAGGVDFAGTSTEPVVQGIAQGAEVKVVYTYSPVLSVAFAVRDNIKTLADLKGKKIGIQEAGGFADAMSRLVLGKAGIDPKDVQFVTTTTAGRVTQLIEGSVDTGVLHVDQVLTIQKRAPNIKILANMWDVAPDYQYAVYAVPVALMKSDPATVECLVRALMRANRAMYDDSLRAQVLDIAVKETKADRDVVEKAFDTLRAAKAWPQNEGVPQRNIEGTIKVLKESKQLTKDVTFQDIVDLSIAQKVVQQLGKKDFPY